MKTLQIIFSLVVTLGFLSCAGKPVAENFPAPLTVVHSVDRHLEFEPCGCAFRPLGGLAREWNYISGLKKDGRQLLYLTSGRTFFPMGSEFTKKQVKSSQTKAPYLFEAFHTMGVSLLAPAAEDLNLGEKFLKGEAKRHGIKLLATNLVGKSGTPVFENFVEFPYQGRQVVVLSILTKGKAPKAYRLENEGAVLAKVIESKKGAFFILMSDGDEAYRSSLSKKYPDLNLVLGSQGLGTPFQAFQLQKSTVHASVRGMGKSIVAIDLDIKWPLIGLYSAGMSAQMTSNESFWKKRLEQKDEVETTTELLRQVASVPREEGKNSRYEISLVDLDEKFERPEANPVTPIVERMKETVRKINMAGE